MRKAAKSKITTQPDDVDIQVGARVRELRTLRGLTQEELGKAMRDTLSHQQIQKYEKGENSISCARLAQLAEVLEVTAASFLEGVGASNANAAAAPTTTYDQKALTKVIESLPNASMKKAVVDFLKIVSDNTRKSA